MRNMLLALTIVGLAIGSANAAVTAVTTHGPEATSLNSSIVVGDLLSGLVGTELPGYLDWHAANTDPLDRLAAFTDDDGIRPSGLTGLLNDFPGAGNPTKMVAYDLGGTFDIAKIQILSGNNGKDGRVFSTTVLHYSIDGGFNYMTLGYFQSDPSGTINSGMWGSTLVEIFDDASATLLAGVTHLQFDLYAVDNTAGQMRDPFDGVNPFTGVDDFLSAAFVAPLIFELDVVAVPEPGALAILAVGGGLLLLRRRSTA
jgi:hypothetical protein